MKKIQENKGYTGVEVAVSIVLILIFLSVISVIFTNIYLSFTDNKRSVEATAYATQIIEMTQKMYYADVTNENLAKKIMEMNIPQGYDISVQISNYQNGENQTDDLVKDITVTAKYSVGKQVKTIEFNTVKAKEILITPNKPVLEKNMVPLKYVITDRQTNEGYLQITGEDDPLWYSYENKRWANVGIIDGLELESGIHVTEENKKELIGEKVSKIEKMYVWIPKFAYKDSNVTFIYSTSNSYVNDDGNLEDINTKQGYVMHNAFENKKGVWIEKYDTKEVANSKLTNPTQDDLKAVKILLNSSYGDILNLVK